MYMELCLGNQAAESEIKNLNWIELIKHHIWSAYSLHTTKNNIKKSGGPFFKFELYDLKCPNYHKFSLKLFFLKKLDPFNKDQLWSAYPPYDNKENIKRNLKRTPEAVRCPLTSNQTTQAAIRTQTGGNSHTHSISWYDKWSRQLPRRRKQPPYHLKEAGSRLKVHAALPYMCHWIPVKKHEGYHMMNICVQVINGFNSNADDDISTTIFIF